MGPLLFAGLALLLAGRSGSSSSHSLRYFYTGVSQPGQGLPWFTVVGYVDNQLTAYYDSNTSRAVPSVPWMEKVVQDDPGYWDSLSQIFQDTEAVFRVALQILRTRFNQSHGGLHTWQWMCGCQVGPDRLPSGGHFQHAYDGRDFLSFDKETLTWTALTPLAQITKQTWEAKKSIAEYYKSYLEETCVDWLWRYLDYGKETLLRTEAPNVKVTQKAGYDGRETLICRAHGFYPKEIEVTWRKDGEDRKPDTFTGGVVPNSDGTYHTWLSIEVDSQERDRYRCQVAHDSLPEPLDFTWEKPASNLALVLGILGGVLVAFIPLMAGGAFCMRHHTLRNMYCCQVGPDGQPRREYSQETHPRTAAESSKQELDSPLATSRGFYVEEESIRLLPRYLDHRKETLQRTEAPTATVIRRKRYDGLEVLICQLYGFFPKEIEITWTKDGEDQMLDTARGGILPNSDGTYYTWSSIRVDPQERDCYRCHVGHVSLQHPLDLGWEETEKRQEKSYKSPPNGYHGPTYASHTVFAWSNTRLVDSCRKRRSMSDSSDTYTSRRRCDTSNTHLRRPASN